MGLRAAATRFADMPGFCGAVFAQPACRRRSMVSNKRPEFCALRQHAKPFLAQRRRVRRVESLLNLNQLPDEPPGRIRHILSGNQLL
jgi:hypothetical protein